MIEVEQGGVEDVNLQHTDGRWVVKIKKTDWEILVIFAFCAAVAFIIVWRLGW
ncbi:MAG TPA: hypothetical protein VMW64_06460 [Dehalococcoidia bacterium]|nr:hypothetical protein [Dehalococcoidia bacterium]